MTLASLHDEVEEYKTLIAKQERQIVRRDKKIAVLQNRLEWEQRRIESLEAWGQEAHAETRRITDLIVARYDNLMAFVGGEPPTVKDGE